MTARAGNGLSDASAFRNVEASQRHLWTAARRSGFFLTPAGKDDLMSSAHENCIITSQDLKMLQSVLEGLGYDSHTMDDEVILYNNAARKVIQLFQDGLTDPADISKEMLFLFGVHKHERVKPWKPLPRYAIQGLPPLYQ
jgi:hypothetical protein